MRITFEPVTLDSTFGDSEGMLALRDGRLLAVLARLGDLHGEDAGRWFVEAVFTAWMQPGETFDALLDFEAMTLATLPAGSR